MSLINDALRRTQQTTQTNEPARLDELELKPVESEQPLVQNGSSGAKRIIWFVVLLVVASNIGLWIVFKDHGNGTPVAARSAEADAVAPRTPEPAPAASVPTATVSTAPAEPAQTHAEGRAEQEPVEGLLAETRPVERPDFKLKTILSHPVRPSAMINDRVLFVGDTIQGYTVSAIGKNDVTLTLGTDAVVLSLP